MRQSTGWIIAGITVAVGIGVVVYLLDPRPEKPNDPAEQERLQGTWHVVAIVLGAALIFFMFPRKNDEQRLLAEYHAQDTKS